jgi:hypothetical protein
VESGGKWGRVEKSGKHVLGFHEGQFSLYTG